MSDNPEIPEAKDPFEKRVAISIAIAAVLLSYISMRGDNAKTDSILKTSEAADRWSEYQAKSLKEHMAEMEADLLGSLPNAGDTSKKIQELTVRAGKYDGEKAELKKEAKMLQAQAKEGGDMNDRCDFAGLFLQIGIVVASVSILAGQRFLWYTGLALAAFGAVKFFFL